MQRTSFGHRESVMVSIMSSRLSTLVFSLMLSWNSWLSCSVFGAQEVIRRMMLSSVVY